MFLLPGQSPLPPLPYPTPPPPPQPSLPPRWTLPEVNPAPPPGLQQFGIDVMAWSKWIGIFAVFVGLVICAVMMALGRRRSSEMAAQGMTGLPYVIAAALIIAGATGIVTGLLNGG